MNQQHNADTLRVFGHVWVKNPKTGKHILKPSK